MLTKGRWLLINSVANDLKETSHGKNSRFVVNIAAVHHGYMTCMAFISYIACMVRNWYVNTLTRASATWPLRTKNILFLGFNLGTIHLILDPTHSISLKTITFKYIIALHKIASQTYILKYMQSLTDTLYIYISVKKHWMCLLHHMQYNYHKHHMHYMYKMLYIEYNTHTVCTLYGTSTNCIRHRIYLIFFGLHYIAARRCTHTVISIYIYT